MTTRDRWSAAWSYLGIHTDTPSCAWQLRDEYAWVPAVTFCQRRAAILAASLARETIYSTVFFQSRYEAQARANLARSMAQWRG